MRKLIAILAGLAMAAVVQANLLTANMPVVLGTGTAGTNGTTAISGYLDEIILYAPTSGAIHVTATPTYGAAVSLGSVIATEAGYTLSRLRVDGTDYLGAALTGDPPGRYLSVADRITATVTNSAATGLTWRVFFKFDDGR